MYSMTGNCKLKELVRNPPDEATYLCRYIPGKTKFLFRSRHDTYVGLRGVTREASRWAREGNTVRRGEQLPSRLNQDGDGDGDGETRKRLWETKWDPFFSQQEKKVSDATNHAYKHVTVSGPVANSLSNIVPSRSDQNKKKKEKEKNRDVGYLSGAARVARTSS